MITPRTQVPELEVGTVNDDTFSLQSDNPENFTVVVFYRGLHCPVCKRYLQSIDKLLPDAQEAGIHVIAVSSDSKERAQQSQQEWGIENLTIGYGLSIEKAREFGLFVSESIKDKEPKVFSESGLFVIKPDNTLYASSVQTMPFARPDFKEVLGGLNFVVKNDYPARGELQAREKAHA